MFKRNILKLIELRILINPASRLSFEPGQVSRDKLNDEYTNRLNSEF